MLLTVLIVETMFLYSRLASAITLLRRERANRLLSVEAVTGAVAHELGTPLGAIALNASTALSQLQSTPPDLEGLEEILSDIEADSHRAGATISSIRELTTKTIQRTAQTSAEDVGRLALRLLKHDLQVREISASTEFQGKLPEVQIDSIELQQVLLNLIRNAIHAMVSLPPGSRRLLLKTSFDGQSTVLMSVEDLSRLPPRASFCALPRYQENPLRPAERRSPKRANDGERSLWSNSEVRGAQLGSPPCPLDQTWSPATSPANFRARNS